MIINLNPKKILYSLFIFIFVLFLLNFLVLFIKFYFGYGRLLGLIPLFDFDKEMNIPTLYSCFTLICSSMLLAIISFKQKQLKNPYLSWLFLALIFLFLSVDEMASIHESLTDPTSDFFNATGIFTFSWVIPYSALVVIFSLVYLRFLIRLPKRIMVLFIISGITFITGAIGFEILEAWQLDLFGRNRLQAVFYTCGELLEMIAIALFIYSLLLYIIDEFNGLTINVSINKDINTS
jgi:hypothetical protein